ARAVSNEELAGALGASAARLAELTGVTRRHHADDGHGPSDLAREAALAALAGAGLEPADVDLIVFATMTPDVAFPGSGCYLQNKLGCRTVGALDVRAAVLHSDPDGLERFWCEFPASRHHPARMDREAYRAGSHYYQLDPGAVHPQARAALAGAAQEVLERAGMPADRVALFLVH